MIGPLLMFPQQAKQRKNKDALELQAIEGRLDVLCYRLSESSVRLLENKIGIAGLWDVVKNDIEDAIVYSIGKQTVKNEPLFNLLRGLLDTQRNKGRM
jgi:hypothetical protein